MTFKKIFLIKLKNNAKPLAILRLKTNTLVNVLIASTRFFFLFLFYNN